MWRGIWEGNPEEKDRIWPIYESSDKRNWGIKGYKGRVQERSR